MGNISNQFMPSDRTFLPVAYVYCIYILHSVITIKDGLCINGELKQNKSPLEEMASNGNGLVKKVFDCSKIIFDDIYRH